MIVAVSEIHLGHGKSDSNAFDIFVEPILKSLGKDGHLVLLGDILKLWREKNLDSVANNEGILRVILTYKANQCILYYYSELFYSVKQI